MHKHYYLLASICLLTSIFSYLCWHAFPAYAQDAIPSVVAAKQRPLGVPITTTTKYTERHPSSLQPVLTWKKYKGAPVYEIEVKIQDEILFTDRAIYINGYNFSLPANFKAKSFAWRVRALDLDCQPMNTYSKWEQVFVNPKLPLDRRPLPTNKFNKIKGANLLYPVYNWIPVHGIRHYEVEVLNAAPADNITAAPADILVERGRSTGFDWYDDEKHISTRPLYWRVRGITEDGQPLTNFSAPQKFSANPKKNYKFATLGDSITHGGGSLSYSPSDWEYSYQCYLDFDSINVGQSGDTSASTLARFEDDVLPFHPEYIFIMTGSNSLRGGTSGYSVIMDLWRLKRKCLKNNIKPIFITLPPINPANIERAFNEDTVLNWQAEFAIVNKWIRKQVHIDLGKYFDEAKILPTAMALDGLHLDIDGKRMIAKAINEQFSEE